MIFLISKQISDLFNGLIFIMTLTCIHQYFDPYAPEESQADVLLCALSKLRHFESVLPGCQI